LLLFSPFVLFVVVGSLSLSLSLSRSRSVSLSPSSFFSCMEH